MIFVDKRNSKVLVAIFCGVIGMLGCKPRADKDTAQLQTSSDGQSRATSKATWYTQTLSVPTHIRFGRNKVIQPIGELVGGYDSNHGSTGKPAVSSDGKTLVTYWTVSYEKKTVVEWLEARSWGRDSYGKRFFGYPMDVAIDYVGGLTSMQMPALLADGTVVLNLGTNAKFANKDKVESKVNFNFNIQPKADSKTGSAPAVLKDGETVVVGTHGKPNVFWFNRNGQLATFTTGAPVDSSPAVLSDDTVVVASTDRKMYWLKNGQKLHEFAIAVDASVSPAVLSDDTVVVGSTDGKVYWLKAENGAIVSKEYLTPNKTVTSPSVMDDDSIVIGGLKGSVYWLKNGALLHKISLDRFISGAPAILPGGIVAVYGDENDGSSPGMFWLKEGKIIKQVLRKDVFGRQIVPGPRSAWLSSSGIAVLTDGMLALQTLDGVFYYR